MALMSARQWTWAISDFDKPGERVEPISVEAQGEWPTDVSPDGRFLLTISKNGAHMRSMEDLSLVWTRSNDQKPFIGGLFLDDGGVVALDTGDPGGSFRTGLFDTVQGFEIGHNVTFDPKTANQRGRMERLEECSNKFHSRRVVVAATLMKR